MVLRAVIVVVPLLGGLAVLPAAANDSQPEILVVTSQLRDAELGTVPAALTVLAPDPATAAGLQHFEQLVPRVPNVNWSGEGARARYFQVRGTGELEQYEGAPNASVGFIVDDIDLSGIGGIATTFDTESIEVLRGPQATRYGANALAGLVYVQTGEPSPTPMARVTGGVAGNDTWSTGGVSTGPVPGSDGALTYRVALQQYASDGFRHNAFLGRDDTAGRDELTARAKLRWEAPGLTAQLTAFHVDLDDGYDDFNLANGFTTWSDQPGEDSQQTDAAALRLAASLAAVDLLSITGVASSDTVYAFDADWGNPDYWAPYVYDFAQRIARSRDTVNQELRVLSKPGRRFLGADWLAGAYVLALDEDIRQRDTGDCDVATCGSDLEFDATTSSRYSATSVAAYGELAWTLPDETRIALGLRRELREASYADSGGGRIAPDDRMTGGDVTLTRPLVADGQVDVTAWLRAARGYKAGGFNPGVVGIPEAADRLEFGPETLWNFEAGLRAADVDGRWHASANAFVQRRDDAQIKIPEQFRAGDPTTFLFFTENAGSVAVRGVEFEGDALAGPVELRLSAGLLATAIRRFRARPELEGRELAHAPAYTFAVEALWRGAAGWFAGAGFAGRAGFAIDYCQVADCNDPETRPYHVLDLKAGREWDRWSVEAWCRNVLDERYAVRGFFFGNEPPDFTPTLYTRPGDPRQAGITVSYTW